MPTNATTHIQKIAPAPPRVSAVATPAMWPVPTRDARATQNAWNDEMPTRRHRLPHRHQAYLKASDDAHILA